MLNKTQCTHVPIGASGSSTIKAKDCVLAGGSFHARAGEIFLPMQEYFAGMDCPFPNASLVSSRDMVASVVAGDSVVLAADAHAVITAASRLDIKQQKIIWRIIIFLFVLQGTAK
jgi:hypothetical protein